MQTQYDKFVSAHARHKIRAADSRLDPRRRPGDGVEAGRRFLGAPTSSARRALDQMYGLRVAVVGGGLGGLAAALALRQARSDRV